MSAEVNKEDKPNNPKISLLIDVVASDAIPIIVREKVATAIKIAARVVAKFFSSTRERLTRFSFNTNALVMGFG